MKQKDNDADISIQGNFYLTFYILTQALSSDDLENKPFSGTIANIIHLVLNYLYCLLMIIQFIIALGNRPQGSKWAYTLSMIFFGLVMGYMMFATVWITVVGVTAAIEDSHGSITAMLGQELFRNIIVSVCATYVMYFVASFMFMDPWHMFTSFVQYVSSWFWINELYDLP